MADSERSFFHVRINIRNDISIRPKTTKLGRQVHLEELTSNVTNEAGDGEVITLRSRDFEKIL